MSEMYEYTRTVTRRYFTDVRKISIDEANVGDIVFVRVYSRQNSMRELTCYGRLMKKTEHCFDVLYYYPADGSKPISYYADSIERIEARRSKKDIARWYKKSIIDLYLATTEDKTEEMTDKGTVLPEDITSYRILT